MKRTMYSLMLSEDVMREIDALAHRMGTNRSNLVNMILAERVEMRTPEQQINDIFSGIEQMLSTSRELIPLLTPNAQRVSVRSNLEYKYRPTLRYEVELANGFAHGEPIGTLSANFRTQSQGLLELLSRFFRCLIRIEDRMLPFDVSYTLSDGRFTRSIAYPTRYGAGQDRAIERVRDLARHHRLRQPGRPHAESLRRRRGCADSVGYVRRRSCAPLHPAVKKHKSHSAKGVEPL